MRNDRFLGLLCMLCTSDLHAMQYPAEACDAHEAAVRAEPTDLDAAARLGRCSVRDYELIALDGDSSRLVFRSSWSTALRALRHAVELDPGFERAYRPLFRILFAETRDACSPVTGSCRHVSSVARIGDSIRTFPRLVDERSQDPYLGALLESRATRRVSLSEARALAERWATVAPRDRRPHEYLARALLHLGDHSAATVEFELAAALGTPASKRAIFRERVEALIRSDMGEEARRVIDEATADVGRDTTSVFTWRLAALNALVGRDRPIVYAPQPPPPPGTYAPSAPPPPTIEELLAKGDTSGARLLLAQLDSSLVPTPGEWRLPRVDETFLYAAEMHLALGDTVAAESRLSGIDRALYDRRGDFSELESFAWRPWLGRAWLRSGEVAAARGRRDDAMRMFRRVIGLWGGGDVDLQPLVERARTQLAARSTSARTRLMSSGVVRQQPPTHRAPARSQPGTYAVKRSAVPTQHRTAASHVSPEFG